MFLEPYSNVTALGGDDDVYEAIGVPLQTLGASMSAVQQSMYSAATQVREASALMQTVSSLLRDRPYFITEAAPVAAGEPEMAKEPTVTWGTFQWVVTGLLSVIAIVVGVVVSDMRSSISDNTKAVASIQSEISKSNVELVKLGGKVDVTNTKLDMLIAQGEKKTN